MHVPGGEETCSSLNCVTYPISLSRILFIRSVDLLCYCSSSRTDVAEVAHDRPGPCLPLSTFGPFAIPVPLSRVLVPNLQTSADVKQTCHVHVVVRPEASSFMLIFHSIQRMTCFPLCDKRAC